MNEAQGLHTNRESKYLIEIIGDICLPEDPFEEGFVVTDGLANLDVGGLIPLGLADCALISHSQPAVVNYKIHNSIYSVNMENK